MAKALALAGLVLAIAALALGIALWWGLLNAERTITMKIDDVRSSITAEVKTLNSSLTERLASINKTLEELTVRVKRLEKRAAAEREIVIVPVDQPIFDYYVDFLIKYVKKLQFDNKTAGVILLINSPGGAVGATERLYSTIKGLNKTVYAVVAGLAASGAYYTAVAAGRIYATPSSWVGSIGVVALLWPDEYLIDLPDYIYTTGPFKYYGMDLTEFYNDIEKTRANFVAAVLKGRAGRLKADPEVFETAKIFNAETALRLGLIDKIGGLWDAVEDMARELGLKNYTVVDIYEKYNATGFGIVVPLISGNKIPLQFLMNASAPPVFYLWPGAIQIPHHPINVTSMPPAAPPEEKKPYRPYVVLDLSHGNIIPRGFFEVLAKELVERGFALRLARDELSLQQLLENATGLIIVNPTVPFTDLAAEAVYNATRRGVRALYFADMRASGMISAPPFIIITPYSATTVFDPLLTYYNITVIRAVYNFTGLGAHDFAANWQYVHVNGSLFNASRLILLSPTAFAATSGLKLRVKAYMFGYGEDVYTIAVRTGNFTAVGSVRSFTPYFIQLGDNYKFFKTLINWLVEPRPIAPPPKRPSGPTPLIPPIPPHTTYP